MGRPFVGDDMRPIYFSQKCVDGIKDTHKSKEYYGGVIVVGQRKEIFVKSCVTPPILGESVCFVTATIDTVGG